MLHNDLSGGFTTIEIITVITILGIASTMILPNFTLTLDQYKLDIASKKLAKDIMFIQEKSIYDKLIYEILFDMTHKDNYKILKGYKSERVKLPPGIYIDWVNFYRNKLSFSPTGAPRQGGTVALKSKSRTVYVIVSVATGRVRISDDIMLEVVAK